MFVTQKNTAEKRMAKILPRGVTSLFLSTKFLFINAVTITQIYSNRACLFLILYVLVYERTLVSTTIRSRLYIARGSLCLQSITLFHYVPPQFCTAAESIAISNSQRYSSGQQDIQQMDASEISKILNDWASALKIDEEGRKRSYSIRDLIKKYSQDVVAPEGG